MSRRDLDADAREALRAAQELARVAEWHVRHEKDESLRIEAQFLLDQATSVIEQFARFRAAQDGGDPE